MAVAGSEREGVPPQHVAALPPLPVARGEKRPLLPLTPPRHRCAAAAWRDAPAAAPSLPRGSPPATATAGCHRRAVRPCPRRSRRRSAPRSPVRSVQWQCGREQPMAMAVCSGSVITARAAALWQQQRQCRVRQQHTVAARSSSKQYHVIVPPTHTAHSTQPPRGSPRCPPGSGAPDARGERGSCLPAPCMTPGSRWPAAAQLLSRSAATHR